VKTPSSGPSSPLRRLGFVLAIAGAASAFILALAVLAVLAATVGGPLLVQLGELMNGR
jgi:hypothetical protein